MSIKAPIAENLSVTTEEQTDRNTLDEHEPVVPVEDDPVGSKNHLLGH